MSDEAFLVDPGAWLAFVEGPLHGRLVAPVDCECEVCEGSGTPHSTWPTKIRPTVSSEEDAEGEYLLVWLWCPWGAPLEDIAEDESGVFFLPSAFEEGIEQ